jgi:hypothetical protein
MWYITVYLLFGDFPVVTISRICPFTGALNEMTLNCSVDEYVIGEQAYNDGALLQDAFHFLDADEREFIKTGITPEQWNRIFGGAE